MDVVEAEVAFPNEDEVAVGPNKEVVEGVED